MNALKAVGDDKFRAGNFAEAIEKFSVALEREPRFVAAVTNRAAAYLASDDAERCIADCGKALELLGADGSGAGATAAPTDGGVAIDCIPPAGSARYKSFVSTTLVRRGTALCRLGRYPEAVDDYAAALKLDPTNTQLAQDLKRAKARTAVSPSDFCTVK